MEIASVLDLKKTILDSLEERTGSTQTQSLVNPRVESRLAVGYSQTAKNEFQLELRVQSGRGAAYRKALAYKDLAKKEANIEIIPRVDIPTKKAIFEANATVPALSQTVRPLHIGLSIGHIKGGAGTLGAFVSDKRDRDCILSNNHVLALMGQSGARLGDAIYQPGNPPQWPLMAEDEIASLSNFPAIAAGLVNAADSAIAVLPKDADYGTNTIPEGFGFPMQGQLIREATSKEELLAAMKKDDVVCKIGCTTGYTEGRLGAIALDNVPVKTPIGNVLFDNVIQVNWEASDKPFTLPGDSGSLVFKKDGLIAIGLHFAGGVRRVEGREFEVSYSCDIATVLRVHKASLLD